RLAADQELERVLPLRFLGRRGNGVRPPIRVTVPSDHDGLARRVLEAMVAEIEPDDVRARRRRFDAANREREHVEWIITNVNGVPSRSRMDSPARAAASARHDGWRRPGSPGRVGRVLQPVRYLVDRRARACPWRDGPGAAVDGRDGARAG